MMRSYRLFVLAIILLSAVGVLSVGLDVYWVSPRNVSIYDSTDLPEPLSTMEKRVWTDSPTGAGSRSGMPIVHMDSKGLLWMFGGYSNNYFLNAMWNYDLSTDTYRWVAGSATAPKQYQNFGEKGVPSDDVFPGSPFYAASAIDKNDNIWIYGGYEENKMWMFNTTSLQFTYIGGDETNIDANYGELGAESVNYWPGKLQGANMVVDSNNNLWLFGGLKTLTVVNTVWRYNTTTLMWSLQYGDPTSTNYSPDYPNNYYPGRWLPGCTIDENDRVWLFGGFSGASWNDMWSFDIRTVSYNLERVPDETTLPGNVVTYGSYNADNYPQKRDSVRMVDRRDGSIMVFGGRDYDTGEAFHDLWVYDKTSKYWKVVAGSPNNLTDTRPIYGQYRGSGSTLGSRSMYSIESGLNSRGNMIIVGGEHNTDNYFIYNDVWIIPQDQCDLNFYECDPNAACSMNGWTYQCTCKQGYVGDGKTCTVAPPIAAPVATNTPTSGNQPSSNPTAAPVSTPNKNTLSGTSTNSPIMFVAILALMIAQI